jgi:hypothetical protein
MATGFILSHHLPQGNPTVKFSLNLNPDNKETNMIHELRTYVVPDGRMPEHLSLFENILFGIFDRSNIKVVEFWTKRDVNELIYVCEFESEEAKKSAWDAFSADPDWLSLKAQTDPKGPIVTDYTSEILIPVSFPSTR